jgi:hypothetical protein
MLAGILPSTSIHIDEISSSFGLSFGEPLQEFPVPAGYGFGNGPI